MLRLILTLSVFLIATTGESRAQDLQIRFGQSLNLTESALEITADTLEVDQATGATEFTDNVVVNQGDMRLTADSLRIDYRPGADGRQAIERLIASGGVTMVTPSEAVEARTAVYSLSAESLELEGDVMLIQGNNVLSGQRLSINLATGSGRMSGRVRTIIQLDGRP